MRRTDHFYYIPLLDTLKILLNHPEIQAEVMNPHFSNADDEIHDFCDGLHFKNHPLFSSDPTSLQIIAYYDELEVVNPLGSYVIKHKLGCLFFMLANIRPKYRSSLKAINLVAIGKYKDICKYGMDIFLFPFVDDLKTLFCDGITITGANNEKIFYGGLLAFLADNLAAHALGGFKQSMSFALRICRTCMVTSTESQSCYLEEQTLLRNPDMHCAHCNMLNGPLEIHFSTNYGINRRSILEDVPGFSVTTCIPHDIMHDLFEGVVPYELKLFLTYCTQQKRYFTIDDLNNRIKRFDFIYDKPTLIDVNICRSQLKIRQSASQMMSLIRFFPLLIGDKIPENDAHWLSLLLLIKICSISLAPLCNYDTIPYLAQLIQEKLSTFLSLYPTSRLIPKFHYMLHYPSQILHFGTLVHSWTMRQESKLSFIKQCSKRSNFKNITLTAAKKHQLWQCYKMQEENSFIYPSPQASPKAYESEITSEAHHVQIELLKQFSSTARITKHPQWIKLQSFVYRKGSIMLLNYEYLEPSFGRIEDIIVFNDVVIFSFQIYITDFSVSHYNAYAVKPTSDIISLPLSSLFYTRPLHLKNSFSTGDNMMYIVLPFMY